MMKCFLPCFGSSKRRKHSTLANETPNRETHTHVTEGIVEAAIEFARQKIVVEEFIAEERRTKIEEQTNSNAEVTPTKEELIKSFEGIKEKQKKTEKKDINEEEDVLKNFPQEESSESLFSLSINSGKQISPAQNPDFEVNSPIQIHNQFCTRKEESFAFGSNPSDSEKESKEENTKQLEGKLNLGEESSVFEEKEVEKEKAKQSNHSVSEYRYRDCSDEGYDDINLDETDLDVTVEEEDDDDYKEKKNDINRTWVQEESSESLFSLSTDSRKRISSAEKAENEVNSFFRVLNPIENLTQVRVVETKVLRSLTTTNNDIKSLIPLDDPTTPGKENIKHDTDIPVVSPKPSNRKERQRFKLSGENEGIRVDTSLSSWLVESETTPISKCGSDNISVGEGTPKGRGSPTSHEDRPILGALTVDEIRKYSVSDKSTMSCRRCRSRSPDETPIIGTVGSYWSHTEQSMDSDFNTSGKDAKVKWSSTKMKTRLEQAFEATVGEV